MPDFKEKELKVVFFILSHKLLSLFLCYPKNMLLLCTKFGKYGHETAHRTLRQTYMIRKCIAPFLLGRAMHFLYMEAPSDSPKKGREEC